MPLALAASTTLDLAVSNSLLSVGCATAFSCTVESTITRVNSFLAISLSVTATSMVRASSGRLGIETVEKSPEGIEFGRLAGLCGKILGVMLDAAGHGLEGRGTVRFFHRRPVALAQKIHTFFVARQPQRHRAAQQDFDFIVPKRGRIVSAADQRENA